MKIVDTLSLLHRGEFAESPEWHTIRDQIHVAIRQAEWPPQSGSFTIYPESGKKSGKGNGVVPIKAKPMSVLEASGWKLEFPWDIAGDDEEAAEVPSDTKGRKGRKPGDIDAAKMFDAGLVVVEWETGNISSSHRAINKMALGLVVGKCVAGVLVVPNRRLAQYLTDRIGNIEEIRPYASLWQNLSVPNGVLEVVAIEQDHESLDVKRIPKGRDGRAREGKKAAQRKARAAKGKKSAARKPATRRTVAG